MVVLRTNMTNVEVCLSLTFYWDGIFGVEVVELILRNTVNKIKLNPQNDCIRCWKQAHKRTPDTEETLKNLKHSIRF